MTIGKGILLATVLAFLAALTGPAWFTGTTARAAEMKAAELVLNRVAEVRTGSEKLTRTGMSRKLWGRYTNKGLFGHIGIYRFRVEVGQRYTLDVEYPGDGNKGKLFLTGDNPFTDDLQLYGPKAPKEIVTPRAFPKGFTAKCRFKFRTNFSVSPESVHNSMWLILVSEKPDADWKVELRHPADAELRVKNDTRARCPGEKPVYRWGNIIPFPVWLGFDPSELKAGAGQVAAGMDLSGDWEAWDEMGRPYLWLTLTQTGTNIVGQGRYEAGTAPVTGYVEDDRLTLRFKFLTPPLLANWLPARVARQVLGISTMAQFRITKGARELNGLVYEFAVVWDGSQQVIASHEGGSPEAAKLKPPWPIVIRRSDKTGPTGHGGASLAGGVWLEAEEEAAFQTGVTASGEQSSLPHSGKGYWYLAKGGDWVLYIFQVSKPGTYHLWLKDYNDGMHPVSDRAVEVSIDCNPVGVFAAIRRPGPEGWGWHKVAQVELKEGHHFIKIRKERTTLAPTILDAVFLTPEPDAKPPDKRELGFVGTGGRG